MGFANWKSHCLSLNSSVKGSKNTLVKCHYCFTNQKLNLKIFKSHWYIGFSLFTITVFFVYATSMISHHFGGIYFPRVNELTKRTIYFALSPVVNQYSYSLHACWVKAQRGTVTIYYRVFSSLWDWVLFIPWRDVYFWYYHKSSTIIIFLIKSMTMFSFVMPVGHGWFF